MNEVDAWEFLFVVRHSHLRFSFGILCYNYHAAVANLGRSGTCQWHKLGVTQVLRGIGDGHVQSVTPYYSTVIVGRSRKKGNYQGNNRKRFSETHDGVLSSRSEGPVLSTAVSRAYLLQKRMSSKLLSPEFSWCSQLQNSPQKIHI